MGNLMSPAKPEVNEIHPVPHFDWTLARTKVGTIGSIPYLGPL